PFIQLRIMQQTRPIVSHRALRERLVSLINEIAKIPVDRVTDSATVDGELRMESVVFVELYIAIEDEFQVELDPLNMVELNRFGAIVDYVYDAVFATWKGC